MQVAGNGRVEGYAYGADGLRRRKATADGTTEFVWDQQNVLAEVSEGATAAQYTDFPGYWGGLSSARKGDESSHFTYDMSANTRQVTDAGGAVVSAPVYTAFGTELAASTAAVGFGGQTGYQKDSPDRDYVGARHYEPSRGRWLSAEPLFAYAGMGGDYGYCHNDPVGFIDPSGLKEDALYCGERWPLIWDCAAHPNTHHDRCQALKDRCPDSYAYAWAQAHPAPPHKRRRRGHGAPAPQETWDYNPGPAPVPLGRPAVSTLRSAIPLSENTLGDDTWGDYFLNDYLHDMGQVLAGEAAGVAGLVSGVLQALPYANPMTAPLMMLRSSSQGVQFLRAHGINRAAVANWLGGGLSALWAGVNPVPSGRADLRRAGTAVMGDAFMIAPFFRGVPSPRFTSGTAGFGLLGRVQPAEVLPWEQSALRAEWVDRVFGTPEFGHSLVRYNAWARRLGWLGIKEAPEINTVIAAAGNEYTGAVYARVPYARAACFPIGTRGFGGPQGALLQANLDAQLWGVRWGVRTGRHEGLHFAARLRGQTPNVQHELLVSALTTPEVATPVVAGAGAFVLISGRMLSYGHEIWRLNHSQRGPMGR